MATASQAIYHEKFSMRIGTFINWNVREKTGLTNNEYMLMDFIRFRAGYSEGIGWCTDNRDRLGKYVGVGSRAIQKMIGRLEEKGYLKKNKRHHLKHTPEWDELMESSNHEQSSPQPKKGTNKVPDDHEQSSPIDTNKVLDIKERGEEKEKREQTDLQKNLEKRIGKKQYAVLMKLKEEAGTLSKKKKLLLVDYLELKNQKKKPYTTNRGILTVINKMNKHTDELVAMVVDYTLENEYQGLFWDKFIDKHVDKKTNHGNSQPARRILVGDKIVTA